MDAGKLKDVLEQHKLWFESDGARGHRANLQNAYFQGADLCGANLQNANLQGADLQDTNLRSTDLRGANLRSADLYGADLEGAVFDLNFKKVSWFANAIFSEDQMPWVALNPKFAEFFNTLTWVKAKQLSA